MFCEEKQEPKFHYKTCNCPEANVANVCNSKILTLQEIGHEEKQISMFANIYGNVYNILFFNQSPLIKKIATG